jgi:hypothetical protein
MSPVRSRAAAPEVAFGGNSAATEVAIGGAKAKFGAASAMSF